jgi:hypothetical protein
VERRVGVVVSKVQQRVPTHVEKEFHTARGPLEGGQVERVPTLRIDWYHTTYHTRVVEV